MTLGYHKCNLTPTAITKEQLQYTQEAMRRKSKHFNTKATNTKEDGNVENEGQKSYKANRKQ